MSPSIRNDLNAIFVKEIAEDLLGNRPERFKADHIERILSRIAFHHGGGVDLVPLQDGPRRAGPNGQHHGNDRHGSQLPGRYSGFRGIHMRSPFL